MVIFIKGHAGCVAAFERAAKLEALLCAVVAGFAKALEIERAEEQRLIPLVRGDVINDRCWGSEFELKAVGAERLCLKLASAQSFPCGCTVETQSGFLWSVSIESRSRKELQPGFYRSRLAA